MVFGWLKGHDEREEQTKELTKALGGAARVAAEDGSMVDVSLGDGGRMRVFLPPQFPKERPVLQLMQPSAAPFVDKYNQVQHASLSGWHPKSRVADVVVEVKRALEEASSMAANEEANVALATARSLSMDTTSARPPESPSESQIQLPPLPDDFPEVLDGLSDEELRRFVSDESLLDEALEKLPVVASMRHLLNESHRTRVSSVVRSWSFVRSEPFAVASGRARRPRDGV